MLLKSSITQVSHTSRPMTPDTAAMRPAARRTSSSRLISFTGGSAHLLTMGGAALLCGLTALMAMVPPVAAEPWKTCWFNDQPMACRDQHQGDGSLTIEWRDGLAMTYTLVREGATRSTLRDSLGGLWQREVLVQGNAVFTHAQNGNRIVVPLRADAGLACPAAVRAQIDGLYRWQLARQEHPGPIAMGSQRDRFTPELFSLLERAFALTPADGRFVDFDPFSGTQASTLGATLQGCRPDQAGRLMARVAVQAGLRGRAAEPAQQLGYVLRQTPKEGWRIADIVYLREPSFRLSTYLKELLEKRL